MVIHNGYRITYSTCVKPLFNHKLRLVHPVKLENTFSKPHKTGGYRQKTAFSYKSTKNLASFAVKRRVEIPKPKRIII